VVLCGAISCNVPEWPDVGTESRVDTGADASADAAADAPADAEAGMGTLILRLPGAKADGKANASRHVLSDTVFDRLEYRVILTGPGPAQTWDPVVGGRVETDLQAGIWTIRAEAYDPDDLVSPGATVGFGEATVNIIAGQSASQKISIGLDGDYGNDLTDVYIRSEADLRYYLENFSDNSSVTLHLENDINDEIVSPVGDLSATFDGHGHTIKLAITAPSSLVGLFKNNGGTIKNLKLIGSVDITYEGSVYIGAVASQNSGTIKNVVSTVAVTATYTSNSSSYAGGFAGENLGTIVDCVSGGAVQFNRSGSGTTDPGTGGIAGTNSGTINRCYAYGNVGTTAGVAGGIVGLNGSSSATISNCAALNSEVNNNSASNTSQCRVAGSNFGMLTNNHAYKDMQIGNPALTAADKTAGGKGGADIDAATTLSLPGSDTTLWNAAAPGGLNWPAFQTTLPPVAPVEPPDTPTSPWYWWNTDTSKTIAIPANTVNTTGVSTVYVPSLWFNYP
jgi:hypothetical protein